VVLRAVHRKTRQEFAVKVMQLSTTRPFENEVRASPLLRTLRAAHQSA